MATPARRVVVTGLGLQTPLGQGVAASWAALLAGQGGVRALSPEDTALPGMDEAQAAAVFQQLPSRVAGLVPQAKEAAGAPGGLAPHETSLPRSIQLALLAAQEALRDAGWHPTELSDLCDTGVAIGGGIGPVGEIAAAGQLIYALSLRRLTPHFVPRILINMPAGHVSIKYGFQGPNVAPATACASGAHAIGDAFRMLRDGDASVMLAGGTESCVDALALGGFSRLRALSTGFNDCPGAASRPFDRRRDGFVMGEGAGVMILEEREHALRRGAPRVYAEVAACGMSGDAHHITQPSHDGAGAALAMSRALSRTGLRPQDVSYLNAHATSTPIGDAVEARAVLSVFGRDHALNPQRFALSSTKGATGHLLGAAGAVEAIFSVLALHQGEVPATLNLEEPDAALGDALLRVSARRSMPGMRAAMSNSFGFGGTNTSLLFLSADGGST